MATYRGTFFDSCVVRMASTTGMEGEPVTLPVIVLSSLAKTVVLAVPKVLWSTIIEPYSYCTGKDYVINRLLIPTLGEEVPSLASLKALHVAEMLVDTGVLKPASACQGSTKLLDLTHVDLQLQMAM